MKPSPSVCSLKAIFATIYCSFALVLILFYTTRTSPQPRLHLQPKEKPQSAPQKDPRYLIDTLKCKILDIEPFHPQAKAISRYLNYVPCTKRELLTYTTKNNSVATLHINSKVVKKYASNVRCKVCNIERTDNSDTYWGESGCVIFNQSVQLNGEFVIVSCKSKTSKKIVYKNTHAPIRIKKEVAVKHDLIKNKDKIFNVLLVGIDSISRLGFIRNYPKTLNFLTDNEWLSFKGYNKVADNTYPNVMAMLAGYNISWAYNKCKPNTEHGLTNCPLIWYDFRKLGYATAYAEDETILATFNLDKQGFSKPPTDYYFRNYFLAAESLGGRKMSGLTYCTGPETAGDRILNIAKDFVTTFVNKPNFGLFWMNTFSHGDYNMPSMMDERFRWFFQNISNAGVLEKSFVMFLSDHGARFGEMRHTSIGWLEERLPFFFLWVPHKFRFNFPREYENVKNNVNKLTNPYDLYMTLQHLLVLSGLNYTMKPSAACSKCHSLFSDIENERSCQDAAIEPHWCTCSDFNPINQNNQIVKNASMFLLEHIRKKIHARRGSEICAEYRLGHIVAASIAEKSSYNNDKYIILVVETEPKAVFEATILLRQNTSKTFDIEDDVSRIDKYEYHSHCASNDVLKKLCYCV